MPVRNAASTMRAAIDSVLGQDYAQFRLSIVNDGSTDDSADIARGYAARDNRVTLLDQPPLGLVPALNTGLSEIECDYVARMDADDIMLQGRLQAQLAALDNHAELSAVSSKVKLDPWSEGMGRYVDWLNSLESYDDIVREMFVESPICHPSVMLRTAVLKGIGGYRDQGWAEDYDLWMRLLEAGHRIAQVNQELLVWRDWPQRYTRVSPTCSRDAMWRLKAHFLARRFGLKQWIWGAGRDGRRLARALEVEGVQIEAFIDIDPEKIGGVRRGSVPVVSPDELPPRGAVKVVAAVGVPGARSEIRQILLSRGYREIQDFICAA